MKDTKEISKENLDNVKKSANGILKLYQSGKFTHEELAEQLGIPKQVVGRVTKEFNWIHTKHREQDLESNRKVKMVADYHNLSKLLKYPIAEKIEEIKKKI